MLSNPTDELLELTPTISNSNNFSLERDNERPLILRPHSEIEVPIHFMPSTLGQGDHLAKITFHSEQVMFKLNKILSAYLFHNQVSSNENYG